MSYSDLTWEEKNPAVYLHYPVDISSLKRFLKAEEQKQKRKQRQNKKKVM